jgi:hypothetical protein
MHSWLFAKSSAKLPPAGAGGLANQKLKQLHAPGAAPGLKNNE